MSTDTCLDFEIRILPKTEAGYPVRIKLSDGRDFEGMLPDDIVPWEFSGSAQYSGERLFKVLFNEQLRDAWQVARGKSPEARRIRLYIDTDAQELHKMLPWEWLHDGNAFLSADAATPFSRYLALDTPWDGLIAERPIRVLVAIADLPARDLDEYHLSPIDGTRERVWLEESLQTLQAEGHIELRFLDTPITLERLEEQLRKAAPWHVLHLIAHGRFNEQQTQAALYLQNSTHDLEIIPDKDFSALFARLGNSRPKVIFLAACESAKRAEANAFAGLAPQLVCAGIPSVIAMQDNMTIKSTEAMTPAFYTALCESGEADRALNAARSRLLTGKYTDAFVPVLFMRVKQDKAADVEPQPVIIPDIRRALPPATDFVDREADLDALTSALKQQPLALITGLSGSGKSWLAARLRQALDFNTQTSVVADLSIDADVFGVWHWLGIALTAQGYSDLQTYLDNVVKTGQLDWPTVSAKAVEGLTEHPLLVIIDNLHLARWQKDVSGWQALFRNVMGRLDLGERTRFIALSQKTIGSNLLQAGLPETALFTHELRDLPRDVVMQLAAQEGVTLSQAEADLFYARTGGHAYVTRLLLGWYKKLDAADKQVFLQQTPTRAGLNDPGNKLVQFVMHALPATGQQALAALSISRQPQPIAVLQQIDPMEGLDATLATLQQRHWVIAIPRGYHLHEMAQQVVVGELQTNSPERLKTLHVAWASHYEKQHEDAEALYHYVQASKIESAIDILFSERWQPRSLSLPGISTLYHIAYELWAALSAAAQYKLALQVGEACERISYLQQAVDWYQRAADVAPAVLDEARAMWKQAWVLHRDGQPRAADTKLDEAHEVLAEAPDSPEKTQTQAEWHICRAQMLVERNQIEPTRQSLEIAAHLLDISPDISTRRLHRFATDRPELLYPLADYYRARGWVGLQTQQFTQSIQASERARGLYAQAGDKWMQAICWVNIGHARGRLGDIPGADAAYQEATTLTKDLGDPVFVRMLTLFNAAIDRRDEGQDWAGAARDMREAAELAEQYGRETALQIILHELGRSLIWLGEWAEAEAVLHRKIKLSAKLQNAYEVADGHFALAEYALCAQLAGALSPDAVAAVLQTALTAMAPFTAPKAEAMEEDEATEMPLNATSIEAEWRLTRGELEVAAARIQEAWDNYNHLHPNLEAGEEAGDPVVAGRLAEVQGRILAAQGQETASRQAFNRSLQFLEGCQVFFQARVRYHYAHALRGWGDEAEARRQMQQVAQVCEHLGVAWLAGKACAFLATE